MVAKKGLKAKTAFKRTGSAIFLVLNTFVWYLLTYFVLTNSILPDNEKIPLLLIYNFAIAATAIIGSKLFPRARTKALYLWLFMGAISTFLLNFISGTNILTDSLIAFFFGSSIGIGLPSCLSYFASLATIENRGLIGGIIWSLTGFTVVILALLIDSLQSGIIASIVVLSVWRFLGALIFPLMNKRSKPEEKIVEKPPSYFSIIRDRRVLLYLFPWVMFSIINFAEAPLIQRTFDSLDPGLYTSIVMLEYVFIGIFAIIGGALSDIVGRKRIVIVGFVMLGIEYAALSAFSNSEAIPYLFLVLDGITWGLLFSVFLTVIWGDLGERFGKEKFYTIGGIPFLLSAFLTIVVELYVNSPNTGNESINLATAFSIASFFLFLAVIPLMYAPETLPEKAMKDRDLNSYIEKAKKIAEKEGEKKQNQQKVDTQNEDSNADAEETEEEKKARELAEKYY